MARGQMVRFIAEHAIMQPEGLKDFCDLGYRFDAARYGADRFVFIKEKWRFERAQKAARPLLDESINLKNFTVNTLLLL